MKIFIVCHIVSWEMEVAGVFSSIEKANEFMKNANMSYNRYFLLNNSGFDLDSLAMLPLH